MWIEDLPNGKYKFFERYRDPLTEKLKKVSVTLDRNTPQSKKAAQRELDEKIQNKLKNFSSGEMTLEDAYNKWIANYAETVKLSSLRGMESLWRNADNRIVKNAKLKNITSGIIQQWINAMYYDEKLSFSTVGGYRGLLSNIFRFAKLNGYIDHNPVADVKIDRKMRDKKSDIEQKFLERDELAAVLDYLKTRNWTDRHADMMEFISLTGLRYGELTALKYEDYDGKKVTVNKTLYWNMSKETPIATEPKNIFSNREVGLSNRAIELIDKVIQENELLKSTSKIYQDQGYIFSNSKGNPVYIGNINFALRETKKALGLKKQLSSHTFRHTHVSQLAELGLPIKSIMQRVGHNSPNTTLKIYTHVTKKMEADVLDKLNSLENKND